VIAPVKTSIREELARSHDLVWTAPVKAPDQEQPAASSDKVATRPAFAETA
jgi:hypothetical protein